MRREVDEECRWWDVLVWIKLENRTELEEIEKVTEEWFGRWW